MRYWKGTGEDARLSIVSLHCIDRASLSGIVQAGGDAVHSGADGVVERRIGRRIQRHIRLARAFAAQQIDLNQAERIDVRVTQTHGSEEDGIRFE